MKLLIAKIERRVTSVQRSTALRPAAAGASINRRHYDASITWDRLPRNDKEVWPTPRLRHSPSRLEWLHPRRSALVEPFTRSLGQVVAHARVHVRWMLDAASRVVSRLSNSIVQPFRREPYV